MVGRRQKLAGGLEVPHLACPVCGDPACDDPDTAHPMMTLAGARRRVAQIAALAAGGDYEAAHSHEDALYREALEVIAAGMADDGSELARAVLRTKAITFDRPTA